ncbi:DEDD exonuclease domain-containing protein [Actinotignum sanguinis]|uniref:DEDD exonuclease domain-containing protein n=1 Tax=Actinotignum sanguinis TaxID=1445614 RepID=UPI00242C252D|nr:DEDD exonuclease domain-containing protein [Actinotignum sanguinis]MDK8513244.1 DEDD exonuclease domain-containing protein [Actinotignum sanguinis]MDK8519545.1 DEDD exonuclease domain-containing protein [Actinotignum sanguinis]MDK8748724.1 DEDD exonuclease domain-containing protein [Actinotignum sanguinis]
MTSRRFPRPGTRIDTEPIEAYRSGRPVTPRQLEFTDLGTPLDEVTFVVVDVETTGGRPGAHALTEIGAVKVCDGEVVQEFSSLVNPGVPIPAHITVLTGITTAMTISAPPLREVLPAFLDFLEPAATAPGDGNGNGNGNGMVARNHGAAPPVLVAHNARFDMSHLRGACEALDMDWPRLRVLDTLGLARRIFTRDEVPNHKLSTLAGYCRATVQPSHRALDDARATVDVLHAMIGRLGPLGVTHIEDLLTASNPVPAHRRRRAVLADEVPHGPGSYRFIGPNNEVLYVGSSGHMYRRVRQYFTSAEKRHRMAEMVDLATRVETTPTATLLEARVVELRDITRFDPPYNRRSRRPHTRTWIGLETAPVARLKISRSCAAAAVPNSLGPFGSRKAARRAAELIGDEAGLNPAGLNVPRKADLSDCPCHFAAHAPCYLAPRGTVNTGAVALSRARQLLTGSLAEVWDHQMARIARLAGAERFEEAVVERDRLSTLLTAVHRQEMLAPLWRARCVVAVSRREDQWEIILASYGKLLATTTVRTAREVPERAAALRSTTPLLAPPARAAEHAHPEETQLLAVWLADSRSRVLAIESEVPLAVPLASAHRFPASFLSHSASATEPFPE